MSEFEGEVLEKLEEMRTKNLRGGYRSPTAGDIKDMRQPGESTQTVIRHLHPDLAAPLPQQEEKGLIRRIINRLRGHSKK